MAIQVTKRPYTYCFSGNPVHYELFSQQAVADQDIYFEVKVWFESSAGDVVETEGFEYTPVNGFAEVDISAILEGLLKYDLPDFAGTPAEVKEAPSQTGHFYLIFRECTPQNINPTWDSSEIEYKSFVIKAGLSQFKYQGNNFFVNYFKAHVVRYARPFLTWQENRQLKDQRSRFAGLNERMYLAYLLIDDVPQGNLSVIAKVTYTDESFQEHTAAIPVEKNRIYYLPAGAEQWGFSTAKQIWYWEICVKDETLGNQAVLSEVFRYYADNRHNENDLTFHYRNSLSGLDSVRIRGVIEHNLEYTYDEVQMIIRADYFNGHYFDPQRGITNNKELKTYRGDIGWLSKEEQDRLRDLFIKRDTWRVDGNKWVPFLIINKSIKQKTTEDSRWSLPIDFILAHEGDSYYTPESVDLGEGTFTSNVCRATLGTIQALVADGPTGYKTLTLNFIEIDPDDASNQIRWRVVKQSDGAEILPWVTQPFTAPLTFNVPDTDNDIIWEARCLCGNAIQGPKVTKGIRLDLVTVTNGNMTNYTNTGTPFSMTVDGVVGSAGYLGAGSAAGYSLAPGTYATIVLTLHALSPSMVRLYGQTLYKGVINGHVITFTNVTIFIDSTIEVY